MNKSPCLLGFSYIGIPLPFTLNISSGCVHSFNFTLTGLSKVGTIISPPSNAENRSISTSVYKSSPCLSNLGCFEICMFINKSPFTLGILCDSLLILNICPSLMPGFIGTRICLLFMFNIFIFIALKNHFYYVSNSGKKPIG